MSGERERLKSRRDGCAVDGCTEPGEKEHYVSAVLPPDGVKLDIMLRLCERHTREVFPGDVSIGHKPLPNKDGEI